MVGFSATLDQNLPRSGEYRVVRFNVVLTNHAAAYEPSTGKFTAPVNGSYLVGFSGVAYDGQDILLHQNPYFRKYVNFLIEQCRIRRRRSHA